MIKVLIDQNHTKPGFDLENKLSQQIILSLISVVILMSGLQILAHAEGLIDFIPACTLKRLTGIPCPTCGTTRAVLALGHHDVISALSLNPLITLSCLALLIGSTALFFLNILGNRIVFKPSSKEMIGIRRGFIVSVIVNWIYILIRENTL